MVRFRVKGEENTFLYAWTTTPWTLPSNVALCVNPDEDYSRFECDGMTIIMARALIPSVMGDSEIKNEKVMKGKELEYMEYEPLFDFARDLVDK